MSQEETIENIEHIIVYWKPSKEDDLAIIEYNSIKKLYEMYKLQQAELEKLKSLNTINESMIELLKDKTNIQEDIIRSFESGEMIGGKKYEE